jgi:tetratricopeptide (TPR) repeat protein
VIRKLISLGEGCDVAYQLRQHSGDNTAHYFDWLSTPAGGLLHLIRHDFPRYASGNLSLHKADDPKGYVADAPTGIHFHHHFPRRARLLSKEFLSAYESFAEKFDFLATRFRGTVRTHPVCFVRSAISRAQALQLEEAMCRLFPDADMRFIYVVPEGHDFTTPLGKTVSVGTRKTAFGDSIAWARMLTREGLIEKPYRLATAQIVRGAGEGNHLGERKTLSADLLAEARKMNPENPWFAYELGWLELRRWRLFPALRLAREAYSRQPGNPEFMELRLRAERALYRTSRGAAIAEVLPLIHSGEAHTDLLEFVAGLMIDEGRIDDATRLIERSLGQYPFEPRLFHQRARALLLAGRAHEAEHAIDTALTLHPGGKAFIEEKARILGAQGRTRQAHTLVSDALAEKYSYRLAALRAWLALRSGAIFSGQPVAPEKAPKTSLS